MKVLVKIASNGAPPNYQDGDIVAMFKDGHEFTHTEKVGFLILQCEEPIGSMSEKVSPVLGGQDGKKILLRRRWFVPYWSMFPDDLVEIRNFEYEFDATQTVYSLNEISVDKEVVGLLEDII